MAEAAEKPCFAGIPARAIGDDRLKFLHWRVLAAIAIHDRMSAPLGRGRGCSATNQLLATKVGCNYSRLSATLSELERWHYVTRETHPEKRRVRTLRLVYTAEDRQYLGGLDDLPSRDDLCLPNPQKVCAPATNSTRDVCLGEKDRTLKVCADISERRRNLPISDDKRLGINLTYSVETEIDSVETRKDSPEGARFASRLPPMGNLDNPGAMLAQLERALRRDRDIDHAAWSQWCEDISDTYEDVAPIEEWARRLLEECDLAGSTLRSADLMKLSMVAA